MLWKRLLGVALAFCTVIVVGTVGYQLIENNLYPGNEHWSFLDAIYMTVITIASVGFKEVHDLGPAGQVFTIFLILVGGGVLVYGISTVTAFIVEGELSNYLRRRRMQKTIDGLSRHFIVCGADQTGHFAIQEMLKNERDFVVIEREAEKVLKLEEQGILVIEGDATHDDTLKQAGILRAQALLAVLHSDADNMFLTFTAKHLNPKLRVITKAVEDKSGDKMKAAGADAVVMTNFIGGMRMASEALRPSVTSFLDIMLRATDQTIRVEEIVIEANSPLIGKTLEASGLCHVEGVSVVASRVGATKWTYNPARSTPLTEGLTIIVMGNVPLINKLRERALPKG